MIRDKLPLDQEDNPRHNPLRHHDIFKEIFLSLTLFRIIIINKTAHFLRSFFFFTQDYP